MRKIIIFFITFFLLLTSCKEETNELTIYGWEGYIPNDVIELFEAETDIKIQFDTFYSAETMYNEIVNEEKKYDIVIPTDYIVERMIAEKWLLKLDKSILPNTKNVIPTFVKSYFDSNGDYSVPFTFGTLGIAYNKENVNTPYSWNVIFDEKNSGEVVIYKGIREIMTAALKKLGFSLNSQSVLELEKAEKLVLNQNNIVKYQEPINLIEDLSSGKFSYALTYSGDAVIMKQKNPNIGYIVPSEGSRIWVDYLVIPKNATNVKNAHTFINFINRPEIAKLITKESGFSTANQSALNLLDEELINFNGDNVYLFGDNMEIYRDLDEPTMKMYKSIENKIFDSE